MEMNALLIEKAEELLNQNKEVLEKMRLTSVILDVNFVQTALES